MSMSDLRSRELNTVAHFVWVSLAVTSFTLIAIAFSSLVPLKELPIQGYLRQFQRPAHIWLMLLAIGVLAVVAAAQALKRLWHAVNTGVVSLAVPVWAAGLLAFWLLVEFRNPRTAFGSVA